MHRQIWFPERHRNGFGEKFGENHCSYPKQPEAVRQKSFKAGIDRAQEKAMRLAAEVFSKPEYKLPADEARKSVDELQRARQDRIDGLKAP